MKTCNFPSKKQQRQQRALNRIMPVTKQGKSNSCEIETLTNAINVENVRDARSKKDRSAQAKFSRV